MQPSDPGLAALASRFKALVPRRDDVIHAHPAHHPELGDILNRWSPRWRPDSEWITPEVLTKLINDLSIAPRDITAADQDLVRRAETE